MSETSSPNFGLFGARPLQRDLEDSIYAENNNIHIRTTHGIVVIAVDDLLNVIGSTPPEVGDLLQRITILEQALDTVTLILDSIVPQQQNIVQRF